jgi:hypothetical protein
MIEIKRGGPPENSGGSSYVDLRLNVEGTVAETNKTALQIAIPFATSVLAGLTLALSIYLGSLLSGIFISALFLIIPYFMFRAGRRIRIDKNSKTIMSIGFRRSEKPKIIGDIDDISKLQVTSKTLSMGSQSRVFTAYELNLVLRSGERINVLNHNKNYIIQQSATDLANFLNA